VQIVILARFRSLVRKETARSVRAWTARTPDGPIYSPGAREHGRASGPRADSAVKKTALLGLPLY
jgi:hypothetical protein